MAKSSAEQVREPAAEFRAALERETATRREIEYLRSQGEKQRDESAALRLELAASRQENAVLRQLIQDHVAQYQEWDRRRWGLITLLIGAVLSLASGLIVTLARK